jgi:hypothetical protein
MAKLSGLVTPRFHPQVVELEPAGQRISRTTP